MLKVEDGASRKTLRVCHGYCSHVIVVGFWGWFVVVALLGRRWSGRRRRVRRQFLGFVYVFIPVGFCFCFCFCFLICTKDGSVFLFVCRI